jgi:hypothetical protein
MNRTRSCDETDAVELGIGSAGPLEEAEQLHGRLRGHILVPAAEERHGWRDWYVYAKTPPANPRPIGFRKP